MGDQAKVVDSFTPATWATKRYTADVGSRRSFRFAMALTMRTTRRRATTPGLSSSKKRKKQLTIDFCYFSITNCKCIIYCSYSDNLITHSPNLCNSGLVFWFQQSIHGKPINGLIIKK